MPCNKSSLFKFWNLRKHKIGGNQVFSYLLITFNPGRKVNALNAIYCPLELMSLVLVTFFPITDMANRCKASKIVDHRNSHPVPSETGLEKRACCAQPKGPAARFHSPLILSFSPNMYGCCIWNNIGCQEIVLCYLYTGQCVRRVTILIQLDNPSVKTFSHYLT